VSVALRFRRHEMRLAVCRLETNAPLPAWAVGGAFLALVRTPDEVTAVCEQARVPAGAEAEREWAAIELIGPFAFDQTGILAAALAPLAAAGIPIFALSTYATDWILMKHGQMDEAVRALAAAGHNEI
jgi:uncharacterized protein